MAEREPMPIALMIGAGSRTPQLFEHLDKPGAAAQIVCVVSHKALQLDENGNKTQHVVGIQEALKRGIRCDYFNYVQMKAEAEEVAKRRGEEFNEDLFRENYFEILAGFLKQNYPKKPVAVFMHGWDYTTGGRFLDHFPSPWEGVAYVINAHPAQLPDIPGAKTVRLSSDLEIPAITGEHEKVLNKAIALKLPVLGACMHFAKAEPDVGGLVIARTELPIEYKETPEETFKDYDERLTVAESQLLIDVVDLVAKGQIKVVGNMVERI